MCVRVCARVCVYTYTHIYVCIYTNLPVNAKVRLPHPWSYNTVWILDTPDLDEIWTASSLGGWETF